MSHHTLKPKHMKSAKIARKQHHCNGNCAAVPRTTCVEDRTNDTKQCIRLLRVHKTLEFNRSTFLESLRFECGHWKDRGRNTSQVYLRESAQVGRAQWFAFHSRVNSLFVNTRRWWTKGSSLSDLPLCWREWSSVAEALDKTRDTEGSKVVLVGWRHLLFIWTAEFFFFSENIVSLSTQTEFNIHRHSFLVHSTKFYFLGFVYCYKSCAVMQ